MRTHSSFPSALNISVFKDGILCLKYIAAAYTWDQVGMEK